MDRAKIVIKKYENRRLYDTTNSRYINLEEIARIIQEGREVVVVDAVTGEDLTRLVLTQIIVEDAKAADSAFPIDVLRQMVMAGGRATQEGAVTYMKALFDIYQNAYRAMTPPLGPFDFMRASQNAAPGQGFAKPAEPRQETRDRRDSNEVEELRKRVEELESLIPKTRTAKPKGRSARRNRS